MNLESQLREVLHDRAAAAPHQPGDFPAVRARGRRKQRVRQGGVLAGGLAAVVLAVIFVPLSADPTLEITPLGDGLDDAAIVLCIEEFCPPPTDDELARLEADLHADPNVDSVQRESAEQTAERLGVDAEFTAEDTSRLPLVLRLRVQDVTALDATYRDHPGVDRVAVTIDGFPPPPSQARVLADLRDDFGPDDAPSKVEILSTDVIGGALVVVAERTFTEPDTVYADSDVYGMLGAWEPDPDAPDVWRGSGGSISVPADSHGWTASLKLPNGEHVVAWGGVTDPGARIALDGTASGTTHDTAGNPTGLILINRAAEPVIVID